MVANSARGVALFPVGTDGAGGSACYRGVVRRAGADSQSR